MLLFKCFRNPLFASILFADGVCVSVQHAAGTGFPLSGLLALVFQIVFNHRLMTDGESGAGFFRCFLFFQFVTYSGRAAQQIGCRPQITLSRKDAVSGKVLFVTARHQTGEYGGEEVEGVFHCHAVHVRAVNAHRAGAFHHETFAVIVLAEHVQQVLFPAATVRVGGVQAAAATDGAFFFFTGSC